MTGSCKNNKRKKTLKVRKILPVPVDSADFFHDSTHLHEFNYTNVSPSHGASITPKVAKGNTHWDVVPVAQTPEDGMHSKKWAVVKTGGEIRDLSSHSQLKQKSEVICT